MHARRRPRVAGESRSSARSDDRDPQLFGAGIQRLVTDRGWDVDVAVGGVMGRWGSVVGAQLAEHCTPESFDDGVLVVRADSTAWATQVRLLVPTVLRRLAEELGEGVVGQLQVKGPRRRPGDAGRARCVAAARETRTGEVPGHRCPVDPHPLSTGCGLPATGRKSTGSAGAPRRRRVAAEQRRSGHAEPLRDVGGVVLPREPAP